MKSKLFFVIVIIMLIFPGCVVSHDADISEVVPVPAEIPEEISEPITSELQAINTSSTSIIYDELTMDFDGDGELEVLQLTYMGNSQEEEYEHGARLLYIKDNCVQDIRHLFPDSGKIIPSFLQVSTDYSLVPLVLVGYEGNSNAYRLDYQVYYIENGRIEQYSPKDPYLESFGVIDLATSELIDHEGALFAELDTKLRNPESELQIQYFLRINGAQHIGDINEDLIADLEYTIIAYDTNGNYVTGTIWLQENIMGCWKLLFWQLNELQSANCFDDGNELGHLPSSPSIGSSEEMRSNIALTDTVGRYTGLSEGEVIVSRELSPVTGGNLKRFVTYDNLPRKDLPPTDSTTTLREFYGQPLFESKHAITYPLNSDDPSVDLLRFNDYLFPRVNLYTFRFDREGCYETLEIATILDYLISSTKLADFDKYAKDVYLFALCNTRSAEIPGATNCQFKDLVREFHSNLEYTKSEWKYYPASKVYWWGQYESIDRTIAYRSRYYQFLEKGKGSFARILKVNDYTGDGELDALVEDISYNRKLVLIADFTNFHYCFPIRNQQDILSLKSLYDTTLLEEDIEALMAESEEHE